MNKDTLIIKAMEGIELSPTMENNAREKYEAIYNYIDGAGQQYDFKPQGSFLIGTAIRPLKDGKDGNYDLDVLAISRLPKNQITPKDVKHNIGDCLKQNKIYLERLEDEDDNCWTIQYADVSDGVGFALDIVPSVKEYSLGEMKAVSITQKNGDVYDWKYSSSLVFADWFLEINGKFLTNELIQRERERLISNKVYASIDDIPTFAYKTNLQRAVQFIKRHRDIFYDRSQSNKPSTVLITALVTDAVKDTPLLSISDIIDMFTNKIMYDVISIKNGKVVSNPIDPSEDLAAGMTEKDWSTFNRWILNLEKLFKDSEERTFKHGLHNNINTKAFPELIMSATKSVSPVKPWRNNIGRI